MIFQGQAKAEPLPVPVLIGEFYDNRSFNGIALSYGNRKSAP